MIILKDAYQTGIAKYESTIVRNLYKMVLVSKRFRYAVSMITFTTLGDSSVAVEER